MVAAVEPLRFGNVRSHVPGTMHHDDSAVGGWFPWESTLRCTVH